MRFWTWLKLWWYAPIVDPRKGTSLIGEPPPNGSYPVPAPPAAHPSGEIPFEVEKQVLYGKQKAKMTFPAAVPTDPRPWLQGDFQRSMKLAIQAEDWWEAVRLIIIADDYFFYLLHEEQERLQKLAQAKEGQS
jgi:hypothetical protein